MIIAAYVASTTYRNANTLTKAKFQVHFRAWESRHSSISVHTVTYPNYVELIRACLFALFQDLHLGQIQSVRLVFCFSEMTVTTVKDESLEPMRFDSE